MKVIFFGTPHFVIPVLDSLLKNFDVVGIVTAPDKKAGREQKMTPSPIKEHYQNFIYNSAPSYQPLILTPETIDKRTFDKIAPLKPELFVTAAYGKILPKYLLDIPSLGAVNVHPSLLPLYRGPSPIQHTILNGDTVTGVSVMKMDEEMDHGPLLKSLPQEVHHTDTFATLTKHLFEKSAEILPEVIRDYVSGKITPVPQNHEKATYTKIVHKEDGYFELDNPPSKEVLERMTRAYYPWPGVWTKVKIKNQEARIKFLPFDIVQMEGKKPVPSKDFFNGYPQLKEKLSKLY